MKWNGTKWAIFFLHGTNLRLQYRVDIQCYSGPSRFTGLLRNPSPPFFAAFLHQSKVNFGCANLHSLCYALLNPILATEVPPHSKAFTCTYLQVTVITRRSCQAACLIDRSLKQHAGKLEVA